MKTVYKYKITLKSQIDGEFGEFKIEMPYGAVVLSVHTQQNDGYIYAEVDNEQLPEVRKFISIGTGERGLNDKNLGKFIGTYNTGKFIWHLYELH